MTDEEKEFREDLHKQLTKLRQIELLKIGFRNVFWQQGFEADDLIASVCKDKKQDFIVVSSDQDMFQLLSKHVEIYNPMSKKFITKSSFTDKYGVKPKEWATVKAIAGCSSDGVPGVSGVGEKTAIKFMNGDLKQTTKAFVSIANSTDLIERNLKLVKLPLPETLSFKLYNDKVTGSRWDVGMSRMEMNSLMKKYPIHLNRKGLV